MYYKVERFGEMCELNVSLELKKKEQSAARSLARFRDQQASEP